MIKLVLDEMIKIADKFSVKNEKKIKYDLYYVVKKEQLIFLGCDNEERNIHVGVLMIIQLMCVKCLKEKCMA